MLMHASLMSSLLAAFIAILVRQWLNWYLRNQGGESMIERCEYRQRRYDLFCSKFPIIFEALPLLLHASTLLFSFGLFFRLGTTDSSIGTLVYSFVAPAIAIYSAVTGSALGYGALAYQTPVSIALNYVWRARHRISATPPPKQVLSRTYRMLSRRIPWSLRRQPPPIPLDDVLVQQPEQWLESEDHAIIRGANANDGQCVSWVLRKITNPEAFSIAIQFAGTVRWFEKGLKVEPPYGLILSTFGACFKPAGKLYPALRVKAYYSARALLWIRVRAMCVSEEHALKFPLPNIYHDATSPDDDLKDLVGVYRGLDTPGTLTWAYTASPHATPAHQQWTWDVLLHVSWAKWKVQGTFDPLIEPRDRGDWSTIPLSATLNRLLIWCIFLGRPANERVLMVQDKSYAISYFFPLSHSFVLFPAITWKTPYLTYPKQSFRSSRPPTVDAISSHTCCLTWPIGNDGPAV